MDGILATAREEVNFAHLNVLVIKVQYHLCMLRLQSAIRRVFAWKNGNEIHTAVTRRRDREYH